MRSVSVIHASKRALFVGIVGSVLAAGVGPQLLPEPHDGVLHGPEAVGTWTAESGCAERHPPGFDSLRGERLQSCPGCLAHLQSRTAPVAEGAPRSPVPVIALALVPFGSSYRSVLAQLPYRRGPPLF